MGLGKPFWHMADRYFRDAVSLDPARGDCPRNMWAQFVGKSQGQGFAPALMEFKKRMEGK